jgi:hypothetical protein
LRIAKTHDSVAELILFPISKPREDKVMNEKLAYQASVFFSVIAVVLLVVNISLANINRAKQAEVGQRQASIASGQTLSQLNQGLVKAIADMAIKNNDTQLHDLLTSQGITLKTDAAKTDKK